VQMKAPTTSDAVLWSGSGCFGRSPILLGLCSHDDISVHRETCVGRRRRVVRYEKW
jgi:hypothetical protein